MLKHSRNECIDKIGKGVEIAPTSEKRQKLENDDEEFQNLNKTFKPTEQTTSVDKIALSTCMFQIQDRLYIKISNPGDIVSIEIRDYYIPPIGFTYEPLKRGIALTCEQYNKIILLKDSISSALEIVNEDTVDTDQRLPTRKKGTRKGKGKDKDKDKDIKSKEAGPTEFAITESTKVGVKLKKVNDTKEAEVEIVHYSNQDTSENEAINMSEAEWKKLVNLHESKVKKELKRTFKVSLIK